MMITKPAPTIHGHDRYEQAKERRAAMTDVALQTGYIDTVMSNKEEDIYFQTQLTSFTKGLPHNAYGIADRVHYDEFVSAINEPDLGFDVRQGDTGPFAHRKWESPLAGQYYDTQGADPDGVIMPPAPLFGKSEQTAEMALVYAMALLRDVSFVDLGDPTTKIGKVFPDWHACAGKDVTVGDILADLQKLPWFDPNGDPHFADGHGPHKASTAEAARRAANWGPDGTLDISVLFRGSTKGAKQGHYLSQFMLMGTDGRGGAHAPKDGRIAFGTNTIDQKVYVTKDGTDHLQNWADWLLVQQGADVTDTAVDGHSADAWTGGTRYISTPRDLADYVHVDQLYQAYFNACLILLTQNAPLDPGFPTQSEPRATTTKGFAQFGGPHILSLMTEVATRGLKAVRRQKFQIHRRARPEVIAARLTLTANDPLNVAGLEDHAIDAMQATFAELGGGKGHHGLLLSLIAQHNAAATDTEQQVGDITVTPDQNYLLPMAFPEGSPMHPAYGAGHATVAGACVTMLKAFFKHDAKFLDLQGVTSGFVPSADGQTLSEDAAAVGADTTIGEELDKLAANVAIGRNMAGVHFHTDYFDSLRMGERVAVAQLREMMLNFTEKVSLTFETFDGDEITIATNGGGAASDVITSVNGAPCRRTFHDWWWRYYTPALMASLAA